MGLRKKHVRISMRRFVQVVIIYGVLGWIIDTAYRSYLDHTFASGTIIPFFSIIYAMAAIALIWVDQYSLHEKPVWVKFLVFTFLATLIEYVGGVIGLQVFHERLWDYSYSSLHIGGFVEPAHSIAWGILALILTEWLHPKLMERLNRGYGKT